MNNEDLNRSYQTLSSIEQLETAFPDLQNNKSKLMLLVLTLFFAALGIAGFLSYQNYQLKTSLNELKTKSLILEPTQELTAIPATTEKINESIKDNTECGALDLSSQGIVNPYFQFKLFDESLDQLKLNWINLESDWLKCHITFKVLDNEDANIFLAWGNKTNEDFITNYTEYADAYLNEELTINNVLSGKKVLLKRTIPGSTFTTTYELAYIFQSKERIFVIYTKNSDSEESVILLDKYLQDISMQLTIY